VPLTENSPVTAQPDRIPLRQRWSVSADRDKPPAALQKAGTCASSASVGGTGAL